MTDLSEAAKRALGRVFLVVDGRRYTGWKSIRVTRSIEGLVGTFALEVSDRGGASDLWPIVDGDPCRVEIEDEVVIDGYVDVQDLGYSESSSTQSYEGRDRAADIVDCSMLVADASTKGNKWTYRNIDIAQFATAIAAAHRVKVSVQRNLLLAADPLLVAHPGETGFEAIARAAASAGVLVVSDGAGGIVITRTGTERGVSLVEGVNIKAAQVKYDSTERFYKYLLTSQPPGTDESSGEDLRVQASATDVDVRRQNRVLVIRPDKGYDGAAARRRADWEARTRAAKSAAVTITVQGWKARPGGALWEVNTLSHVRSPRIRVDGLLLISQAEFSVGDGGSLTQLRLVRPDAFTPEPQNVAVVSGEGAWKDQIEKGKF